MLKFEFCFEKEKEINIFKSSCYIAMNLKNMKKKKTPRI